MCVASVWLGLFAVPRPCDADVVVRAGNASISNDSEAGTWTIFSLGTALTLGADSSRDFEILSLSSAGGASWTVRSASDALITVGGQSVAFGSRGSGFVFRGVATSTHDRTVQIDVTYDLTTARLRAVRHYAATSGSPTFETWTTLSPLSGTLTASDLNAFSLTVRPGIIHWLNGLRGDDPNRPTDSAFSLQQRDLGEGDTLDLGSAGRSSEQVVPWFAIESGSETFYGGLLWSGSWSLAISRSAAGVKLKLGLPPMSTTLSGPVDGPHAFFGVVRGGLPSVSGALTSFGQNGLRAGRPYTPLVTYNTWFVYGTAIDEPTMRSEIDGAARLGAELFVVDAGWYVGAGRSGVSDFSSGLGTWEVDPVRFPHGLRALTDYAHTRGMKFGIWVEPERVAQSTLNRAGLARETWAAKAGGKYGSVDTVQICLAGAAARQWVFDQLVRFIDTVQPDYLKWDNNLWVNCDRAGHEHGTTDGNFAHVRGLYSLLALIRARYPDLLIENVSGGGNRLDLGMLRYSDVAWMDDRSAPSLHVRHNIEGLSALFPPAYLLSFVMEHRDESLHKAPDLSLFFRSRMLGVLGLCFRTGEFDDDETARMIREIDLYKQTSHPLADASGWLLSAQAAAAGGPAWDVFQISSPHADVTIAAFQTDPASDSITIVPHRISPRGVYEVRSVDLGLLGTVTGAELLADGLTVVGTPDSAAHLLVLTQIR